MAGSAEMVSLGLFLPLSFYTRLNWVPKGTRLKFLPLGTMGTRFKFLSLGTMDPIQTSVYCILRKNENALEIFPSHCAILLKMQKSKNGS